MALKDRIFGAEGHWLMGRVMPRQLLDGVGKYLEHFAPDRKDEVLAGIDERAEELVEDDKGALDKIDKACSSMMGIYPVYFEWGSGGRIPHLRDEGPSLLLPRFPRPPRRRASTTIMCAFDVSVHDVDRPAVSGLRAERTTLLSLGDEECTKREIPPSTRSP